MVMAVVTFFATEAVTQQRYVIPVKEEVKVYENMPRKTYEQAIFSLGNTDRAIVLKERNDALRIKDHQGRTGWVERKLVRSVAAGNQITFGNETVYGHLNAPSPIYVGGTDQPGDYGLLLHRSFRNELSTNIDRPTLERQSE